MANIIIKALGFVGIIFLGYILKNRGMFTKEHGNFVGKVVVNITLPCALLSSANSMDVTLSLMLILVLGVLANLGPIFVAYFSEKRRGPMSQAISMLNMSGMSIGAFALPFVQSFFPASYLTYICLFDIGNSLLCLGGTYTLASLVAHPYEKTTIRKVIGSLFSSMPFCTYILVFLLACFKFRIPEQILIVINIAGNANVFLCMLMIGILLELKLEGSRRREISSILIRRYALLILFAVCVWLFVPLDVEIKKIITILLSAPTAQSTPIFSMQLDPDNTIPPAVSSITIIITLIVMPILVILFA